jgi:hypothetical protein
MNTVWADGARIFNAQTVEQKREWAEEFAWALASSFLAVTIDNEAQTPGLPINPYLQFSDFNKMTTWRF